MTVTTKDTIRELLKTSRTIALVGASNRSGRPANYVPGYMARSGYEVLPVNPRHRGETLWDRAVAAKLVELEEPVDIVNVFRRSHDVPDHLEDILAMRPLPRAVWLQLGIRNDEVAQRLESTGIEVIQDRCILIEHRELSQA